MDLDLDLEEEPPEDEDSDEDDRVFFVLVGLSHSVILKSISQSLGQAVRAKMKIRTMMKTVMCSMMNLRREAQEKKRLVLASWKNQPLSALV